MGAASWVSRIKKRKRITQCPGNLGRFVKKHNEEKLLISLPIMRKF